MTRLEQYMKMFLATGVYPYQGFLGAYNMGVWGLSVSGRGPLEQGLLVSGKVLTNAPRWTVGPGVVEAQNFVAYYDTPNLWGFGDDRSQMDEEAVRQLDMAYFMIADRAKPKGEGYSKKEVEMLKGILKTHMKTDWQGSYEGVAAWEEVARTNLVQQEMDRKGAWTKLVQRWKAVVAQSRQLVDITSLSPPVTGSEVQIALCEGIAACLENWLKEAAKDPSKAPFLMIRIMFGMTVANMYLTGMNTYWKDFYKLLEKTLKPLAGRIKASGAPKLPVLLYGSDMGRIVATFNHSKIVAGDGQYAVVGGHNMCEEVSSNRAPVIHDLTAEVTGPGAISANAFAGSLWLKAAESGRLYIYRFSWENSELEDLSSESAKRWAPDNVWYYELGKQEEVPKVLTNQFWYYPMQTLPRKARLPPPEGSVPAAAVMGVGRWGDTKVFSLDASGGLQLGNRISGRFACHYASDALKHLMIEDTNNTVIRMSQQDLINTGFFGRQQASQHVICDLLGKRLKATPRGTTIQVIVSSRFTQNAEGLAYSYGDGPREAIERISDSVVGVPHASTDVKNPPKRLAALGLKEEAGSAEVHRINSPMDASFCTVAPLAFAEARGTDRKRGSYVWPDAKYTMERVYTNGRFWNKDDDKELTFGPGNHSKVLYVSKGEDDATGLVLIGSDNMYPSPLSEFSFVIEGAEAIKAFREQYWDRLWGYSARLGFTVHSDGNVT